MRASSAARENKNTALGYHHTEKARKSMSKSRIGNRNALGAKHSAEWKALMSRKMKSRVMQPFTDEHRRKLSIAAHNRKTRGTRAYDDRDGRGDVRVISSTKL
jgi:hypothetical protein